jgi:hypothetical protein
MRAKNRSYTTPENRKLARSFLYFSNGAFYGQTLKSDDFEQNVNQKTCKNQFFIYIPLNFDLFFFRRECWRGESLIFPFQLRSLALLVIQ